VDNNNTSICKAHNVSIRAESEAPIKAYCDQLLKWTCEAGGGSPDEARLEQTPYPFQPH